MSQFKFKRDAGSLPMLIDTFGEEAALDSYSAKPARRPTEIPKAAEREGLYEVRKERSGRRVYVFHDSQWYLTGRDTEYLYGWHEPSHMTPKELESLRILWNAGLDHMLSQEAKRALARHRHHSVLRDIRRRARLQDMRARGS